MTEDTSLRDLIESARVKKATEYTGPTSQAPTGVVQPTKPYGNGCASCQRARDHRFPVHTEYVTSDGVHHRHGYQPVFGL